MSDKEQADKESERKERHEQSRAVTAETLSMLSRYLPQTPAQELEQAVLLTLRKQPS